MSCAFMPCSLKINNNGGFKRVCGIMYFNHEQHIAPTVIPMTTKLGRVLASDEILPPIISHDPLITNLVRSCDKKVHLHYHNAHGHEIWRGGDFP